MSRRVSGAPIGVATPLPPIPHRIRYVNRLRPTVRAPLERGCAPEHPGQRREPAAARRPGRAGAAEAHVLRADPGHERAVLDRPVPCLRQAGAIDRRCGGRVPGQGWRGNLLRTAGLGRGDDGRLRREGPVPLRVPAEAPGAAGLGAVHRPVPVLHLRGRPARHRIEALDEPEKRRARFVAKLRYEVDATIRALARLETRLTEICGSRTR